MHETRHQEWGEDKLNRERNNHAHRRGAGTLLALLLAGLLLAGGCRQGMYDQPRLKPLQEFGMFPDHQGSRPLPPGAVQAGQASDPTTMTSGRINGKLIDVVPMKLTRALLERGQERFNIYCSPCHDKMGHGTGMVVRRGFLMPPSYHIERLVNAPDGYFFEVMTQGYGTMYSYASRVAPEDRWAITAYIRALQYRERAKLDDAPPPQRAALEGSKP